MKILFSRQEITEAVKRVAREISGDFFLEEIVFVGVLKGCVPFMSDLTKFVSSPCAMEYIVASSYGDDTEPSSLQIHYKTGSPLKGKNIVVVDDIIDTGQTLSKVVDLLWKEEPKRVVTCVLIDKLPRREAPFQPTYRCFELHTDQFVCGYGLDLKEHMRNSQEVFAV